MKTFFNMMDITIFTAGEGQGALTVHKNEKITRTVSTHTKIKFPITFI